MLDQLSNFLSSPAARAMAWTAGAICLVLVSLLLWRLNLTLTLASLRRRHEQLALQVSLIERERHYLERMRSELALGKTD